MVPSIWSHSAAKLAASGLDRNTVRAENLTRVPISVAASRKETNASNSAADRSCRTPETRCPGTGSPHEPQMEQIRAIRAEPDIAADPAHTGRAEPWAIRCCNRLQPEKKDSGLKQPLLAVSARAGQRRGSRRRLSNADAIRRRKAARKHTRNRKILRSRSAEPTDLANGNAFLLTAPAKTARLGPR